MYSFCHQCPTVAPGHRKHARNTAWLSSCAVLSHGSDLFTLTLLAYFLRFLTSDYSSTRFLHWLWFYHGGDFPFRVLLFVDIPFHVFTSGSLRLPFSYSAKNVLLASDVIWWPKKEGTRNKRLKWGQLGLQSCGCKFNTEEEKWANKCEAALCTRMTTTTHGLSSSSSC